MELKINYQNATNKEEAYNCVKQAVTPELLAKWKVKAELTYNDGKINAKGKGFSLDLSFFEDHCLVKLDLSFLLKPLKSKISEGIEKQLKRVV